jgi:hypothetical protein
MSNSQKALIYWVILVTIGITLGIIISDWLKMVLG